VNRLTNSFPHSLESGQCDQASARRLLGIQRSFAAALVRVVPQRSSTARTVAHNDPHSSELKRQPESPVDGRGCSWLMQWPGAAASPTQSSPVTYSEAARLHRTGRLEDIAPMAACPETVSRKGVQRVGAISTSFPRGGN
jgi:hypothetical protein